MIIGAGLAGMIAAHIFPREEIFELRDREHVEHQALLRFRSPAISELTGIPFRAVTVRKGIWLNGEWSPATVAACNMYALKVIGRLADRSIWDIEPCQRWIPPVDFHTRLCDALEGRVHWKIPVTGSILKDNPEGAFVISTAPLAIMAEAMLGYKGEFLSSPIVTSAAEVPKSDVFQSVYFPAAHHGLYRATLEGERLTLEWTGDTARAMGDVTSAAREVAAAFGSEMLEDYTLDSLSALHSQKYGKLIPLEGNLRKNLILRLTTGFNIYSLGRFATWRNVLLDDVVHDAAVIKRLISVGHYEQHLMAQEG